MDSVDYFIEAGRFVEALLDPFAQKVHASFAATFPRHYALASDWLDTVRSPLADRLPLMDPVHVMLLISAYLFIVHAGRKLMENQKRLNLRVFALFHNLFLTSLSLFMVVEIFRRFKSSNYSFYGNPLDTTETGLPMAKIVWLFYFSKPYEFVDTFIMVLKKNDRQISFLHLFHHASVVAYMWLVLFVAPNGDAYLSASLNSFVHVVMYAYYLFSGLGIKRVSLIRPFITVGQITQFCVMIAHSSYGVMDYLWWRGPEKTYPIMISVVHIVYMMAMLVLFLNFFIRDRTRREALRKSAFKEKKSS